MQLSPEGWLRCKVKFEADLVVSSALDIPGVVPSGNGRTTMAQIVRPAAASSSTSLAEKYPASSHLLFHATNPQEAPATVISTDSTGQPVRMLIADAESTPGNAFALHKFGLVAKSFH